MTEESSRLTACELLDVGHTRLATLLRDGLLAGLTLMEVLAARNSAGSPSLSPPSSST